MLFLVRNKQFYKIITKNFIIWFGIFPKKIETNLKVTLYFIVT